MLAKRIAVVFTLALVLMAGIREKLALAALSDVVQGAAIALMVAGAGRRTLRTMSAPLSVAAAPFAMEAPASFSRLSEKKDPLPAPD